MSALDALLGQLAISGQLIELRGILNFADGFGHSADPNANTLRVVKGDPTATGAVTTTGATITPLLTVGTLPDNTIALVRARIVGRIASPSSTAMAYEVTQAFKKINAGSPATFGSADVPLSVKDDAAWGTPTFTLVGDVLTLNVTGKAATTILWSGKVWLALETLPTP